MSKETLTVHYQHYVPDEIFAEFKDLKLDKELDVELVLKKEEEKYYNFSGSEIADILLYFEQNQTALLIGGLLMPAVYDLLKSGIKSLWKSVSKLSVKIVQSGGITEDKQKSVSLRLMEKDRSIEIVLDGQIEDSSIDKIIDQSFEYLKSGKQEKDFKNEDFIPNSPGKPRIRLKYNKDKKVWEPENFGLYRRQMEEFQKIAKKKFDQR